MNSLMESHLDGAVSSLAASSSYTLWRYPEDRSDPRNRVEIDERTRRAIEDEPAHGRPSWVAELSKMLLYPMLFEATRTSWFANPTDTRSSLRVVLADHVDHVLRNTRRGEAEFAPDSGRRRLDPTPEAVVEGLVQVDGMERVGVQYDDDPCVHAVGFRIDDNSVCTTVVPRNALAMVTLDHVLLD
ncbi:hypothetical protein ACFY9N_00035 [Microbacterium sp. NPDC008134]|uniref:hypothetical protein n=1 Tax=Microbacterium sp. NPDC008134 TaxID=3364183 RepID=UPI0036E4709A